MSTSDLDKKFQKIAQGLNYALTEQMPIYDFMNYKMQTNPNDWKLNYAPWMIPLSHVLLAQSKIESDLFDVLEEIAGSRV